MHSIKKNNFLWLCTHMQSEISSLCEHTVRSNGLPLSAEMKFNPLNRIAMGYYDDETYDEYNGTYVQDVEGWSDQMIDDVLDGEPDAYWNID